MKTHILLIFSSTKITFGRNNPEKIMESFEDGIPSSLSTRGGKLSIDSMRMKHGKFALCWDWIGNDALIFNTPIGYHKQRDLSSNNRGLDRFEFICP